MISFKAIQTSFIPKISSLHQREYFKKKRFLFFCTSKNASDNSDQETFLLHLKEICRQEILARIAMLQPQRVHLTDYLDERSVYLTQFDEEANSEIDQIGENALRESDEAGFRIMGNTKSRMQAFEESMELNRTEIAENEKKVAGFEGQIEKDRNEGFSFKSLMDKTQADKEKAKEEADKVREVAKKIAGSVIRRNTYLALTGLVVIGVADASDSWKKVADLGVILMGLLSQLFYEQSILSETESTERKKSKN